MCESNTKTPCTKSCVRTNFGIQAKGGWIQKRVTNGTNFGTFEMAIARAD